MYKTTTTPSLPLCAFCGGRLLLREAGGGGAPCRLPLEAEVPEALLAGRTVHCVLMPTGLEVLAAGLDVLPCGAGWRAEGLRDSWALLPQAEHRAAGKAAEILYWDAHSRFCPACGAPMARVTDIMKRCPQCGHELYPPVAPAVIVRVTRGRDEVLLVHARNFRGTFYGLVAGFVEAGETLEECVRREVREETGLSIDRLRYFGSQPWPYPCSLMAAFTAEYAGGEIKLQDDELTAGAFYRRDSLPELPKPPSIARQLIEDWIGEIEN